MKKHLLLFFVALLGFTLLKLEMNGLLIHYIHPSTVWMVIVAAIVLIIMCVIWIVQLPNHSHATCFQMSIFACLTIILVIGKGTSLSSQTTKLWQDNSLSPITSRSGISIQGLTQYFTILDWLAAWNASPIHQNYIGTSVDITGTIAKKGDQYSVQRLLITCCVVDAQIAQLSISTIDSVPPEGTWVRVQGIMTEGKDSEPLVQVKTLNVVSEPDNPYVY